MRPVALCDRSISLRTPPQGTYPRTGGVASQSRLSPGLNRSSGVRTCTRPESQAAGLRSVRREDPTLHRVDVTTLGDLLLKAYDQYPDHAALIFPDSTWTYRELVGRLQIARG